MYIALIMVKAKIPLKLIISSEGVKANLAYLESCDILI